MKEIQVAGIGKSIPVVGFGCSSLTSVGRREALRLLEAAFDAGIRHFDVARYYGYGEAEGILGEFLKTRRGQVTVTTKFGIDPPRRTSALRLVLRAGRQVLKLVPAARKAVQQRASAILVKGNAFGVADAQRNLETSLRELGTECIDFYLLHDYVPGTASPDELVAFLQQAVSAGKIRHFGVGTGFANVMQALGSEPELCGVVQFQNSVLTRNQERLPVFPMPPGLVITHGALGEAYGSVSSLLRADGKRAKQWSEELGVDCSEEKTLPALLLRYAVEANPGGLVLFSARNATRVRQNARAVLEPGVTYAQVKLFAQLVARDLRSNATLSG
jgi:aryl-alcohol dehydrogenase-like predicted oxidoreductase